MKFKPIPHDVEKDKSYFWCSCGRSKNQPFWDGSHAGILFTHLKYVAEKTETKYFCTCKKTQNKPFCDGSHDKLETVLDDTKLVDLKFLGSTISELTSVNILNSESTRASYP